MVLFFFALSIESINVFSRSFESVLTSDFSTDFQSIDSNSVESLCSILLGFIVSMIPT